MVALSVLILAQEFTIGQINVFREITIAEIIPLRFLIFPITSIFLILRFLKVHIPNRKSE